MENKMPKANLSRQYSTADSESALPLGRRQHFSPSAPMPFPELPRVPAVLLNRTMSAVRGALSCHKCDYYLFEIICLSHSDP